LIFSPRSHILRDTQNLDDILWAINEFAKKLNIKLDSKLEKKANEDWIQKYQNSIKPVEVGSFYIRPVWEAKKENKIDLIINPALAFGSGHHETTSSCIESIDRYIKAKDSVLDVGCGSGILAIAAFKKDAKVDICDTDELALKSAKENFILNNATFNDAWVGSANKSNKEYDLVIANIIADIILLIEDDLKNRVKKNGILILSGIIENYFPKIKESFLDFSIIENIKKGEWHTLVLKKSE
jgi:ribosomal protein L11 methyltransferase